MQVSPGDIYTAMTFIAQILCHACINDPEAVAMNISKAFVRILHARLLHMLNGYCVSV